ALNFATKSGNADPIAGMVVFQRQLWLIGTQTSEIWYDVGGTVTFQRLQGPYNELGCIAPDTIATSDEAVYFVATSQRSGPYVVRSYGNSTQRVSSLPVDLALGSYGQSLISATGFTYNQDGSSFYAINPKNGTSSWYFDETMATLLGAMAPAWAERTYTLPPGTPVGYGLAPGVEVRHLADNHWFYANQYHLVGDYNSPNVYFFDFSNGTDNNAWITRTRQAPHVASERNRIFYYNFRLICQVGVGVGTGPLVNVAATSNTSTANLVLAANVVPGGCTSIGFSSNSGIGVGTFGTLTPNTFNGKNIIGLIETESFGGNAAAFDLYVTDSAATLTQNSYFTSFSFVDRHSNTQTYNANTATFTNPNPILGVAHWNWVPPFQIVYDSFGGAGGDMLITTNVVFSIVTSSPSIYISTSSNPTVSLSWSDDGGFNWSDEITQSIGQVGDYTRVVDFRALGEGRNRAFRVRTSGYAAFNLIDVDLNMYVSPVQ
ncbi:MAG: hypothetical protein ACREQ5_09480, partial [Candidatus Dormibacteria bacterium]